MMLSYPSLNQDAEKVWPFNKKVDDAMNRALRQGCSVENMKPYMVGKLFKRGNDGKFSMLKDSPSMHCPLCR